MAQIYRCLQSFAFGDWVIREGDVVRDDDPRFSGRDYFASKDHFESLAEYATRHTSEVEQATAEPGERRSVSRARKPRAAKPDKPAGPGVDTTKSAPGADGKEGAK